MHQQHLNSKLLRTTALFLALLLVVDLSSCRGRRNSSTRLHVPASTRVSAVTRPLSSKDKRQVIQEARTFIGTPWVSGGVSKTGIDCSGLTLLSYRSVGKELPRNSIMQSEAGSEIALKELYPGDLVFFTDRKGNSRITHVGLVTEVPDTKTIKFIHTTNRLGVVENNLLQPYWANLFVKGVRVN